MYLFRLHICLRGMAYREISKLHAAIACAHYPNVSAVARSEAGGNAVHEQQLLGYARNFVKPAYSVQV